MAGHGGDGFMKFQDQEELTSSELADALAAMHTQVSARRLHCRVSWSVFASSQACLLNIFKSRGHQYRGSHRYLVPRTLSPAQAMYVFSSPWKSLTSSAARRASHTITVAVRQS